MSGLVRYLTKEEIEPVWRELVEAATQKLQGQPYSYERFTAAQAELDQAFRDKMAELYPGHRVLADVRRDWTGKVVAVLLVTE